MKKFNVWNTIIFLGFSIRVVEVLSGNLMKVWEQVYILTTFALLFGINIYQPRKAEK